MTAQNERIIIGETERAGLPMTAAIDLKRLGDEPDTNRHIRWHKKINAFVLEQWTGSEWVEVACVVSE